MTIPKLTDEILKDLIEGLSEVSLGNAAVASDTLGDAYEYLIGKFADVTDQPLRDLPAGNIPTINELTKDQNHRMLLRYGTSAPNQFGKVYMLPTAVPAERAAALEAAFAKTLADKNFLSDAEKGKLEISPIYGESIQRIVNELLAMPADIKVRLKKAIKK